LWSIAAFSAWTMREPAVEQSFDLIDGGGWMLAPQRLAPQFHRRVPQVKRGLKSRAGGFHEDSVA